MTGGKRGGVEGISQGDFAFVTWPGDCGTQSLSGRPLPGPPPLGTCIPRGRTLRLLRKGPEHERKVAGEEQGRTEGLPAAS